MKINPVLGSWHCFMSKIQRSIFYEMTSVYNQSPHEVYFKAPFFLKIRFLRTVLFVESLISLFLTSGVVCPMFQSQGGSLTCMFYHLPAMDIAPGMKPADCLVASMAAKSFLWFIYMHMYIRCHFLFFPESEWCWQKVHYWETQQIEGKCIPRFSSKGHVQSGK